MTRKVRATRRGATANRRCAAKSTRNPSVGAGTGDTLVDALDVWRLVTGASTPHLEEER
jgi:hypothetical protein